MPNSCPSAAKTFLNEKSCVQRATCSPPSFSAQPITLDHGALRQWYSRSGKHVHWVSGLELTGAYAVSPCAVPSRWRKVAAGVCANAAVLDASTATTLAAALSSSGDTANALVRDIAGF